VHLRVQSLYCLLNQLGVRQPLSFFRSSRRRHTRSKRDWSSDVCSSDLNRIRLDESYEKREFTSSPAPANQVDPAEETLVYDADDTVSELVQRARAGESMTVTSPAGTQHLRAALNVAAGLVSEGKSVLFLAERRETLQNVRRRLSELGLSDLTLDLGEDPEPEELHRKFVQTIV